MIYRLRASKLKKQLHSLALNEYEWKTRENVGVVTNITHVYFIMIVQRVVDVVKQHRSALIGALFATTTEAMQTSVIALRSIVLSLTLCCLLMLI